MYTANNAKRSAAEGEDTETSVSFIIPAYNEELHIPSTLRSIKRYAAGLDYEVIVVDNGSTDRTKQLSLKNGAAVLCQMGGTIGSLRNLGAQGSHGEILVFLDADVTLTHKWRAVFGGVVERIMSGRLVLAGSSCSIPSNPSWIESVWFAPRSDEVLSHLGSAHLIVRRSLFLGIGGFDETLETGEDYELSARVVERGGQLCRLPRAVVEHHGYPKTLRQFYCREVWHGTSDSASLSTILKSRVASLSLAVMLLTSIAIASLLAGHPSVAALASATVGTACFAASLRLFRKAGARAVFIGALLHYVYFVARATSVIRVISGKQNARRTRPTVQLQRGARDDSTV